jgi:hypothetical protein
MPRLGKGIHWPAVVAEIERDQRARLAAAEPPPIDFTKPGFGIVSVDEARSWGIKIPPAVELLAMADDLNAHGGVDEQFVAALLRAAVNDTPPPEQPAEPLTYWSMIVILEQLGVLRSTPPVSVADLTPDTFTEIVEGHINAGPHPDAGADAHTEQRRQLQIVQASGGEPSVAERAYLEGGNVAPAIEPWIPADTWDRAIKPAPSMWRRLWNALTRRPR